jgi:hypothetical protein
MLSPGKTAYPKRNKQNFSTETVKVSPPVKQTLDNLMDEGKHLTRDSLIRELLAYRTAFLIEHPEGILNHICNKEV